MIQNASVARPNKYGFRQPNRGVLRMLGFTRTLGRPTQSITSSELRAAGLKEVWVKWLAREEFVCASNPALYIFKGRITDPMARLSRWHPAMTVGLTTALWLASVLPERPSIDHWMIDEAKRRPIWLPPGVVVHRSRHASKDTFHTLMSGISVPAHLPLRAVLDCVRFREVLGQAAVLGAIKAVLASGAVHLPALLAAAKATKVCKPLLHLLAGLSTEVAAATRVTA